MIDLKEEESLKKYKSNRLWGLFMERAWILEISAKSLMCKGIWEVSFVCASYRMVPVVDRAPWVSLCAAWEALFDPSADCLG